MEGWNHSLCQFTSSGSSRGLICDVWESASRSSLRGFHINALAGPLQESQLHVKVLGDDKRGQRGGAGVSVLGRTDAEKSAELTHIAEKNYTGKSSGYKKKKSTHSFQMSSFGDTNETDMNHFKSFRAVNVARNPYR